MPTRLVRRGGHRDECRRAVGGRSSIGFGRELCPSALPASSGSSSSPGKRPRRGWWRPYHAPTVALEVSIGSRVGERARGRDSILFHGTSLDAAKSLLTTPHLDLATATGSKIDGPPGFFLAAAAVDAQYFALRRARPASSPAVGFRFGEEQPSRPTRLLLVRSGRLGHCAIRSRSREEQQARPGHALFRMRRLPAW
jgi:hypothetical protein